MRRTICTISFIALLFLSGCASDKKTVQDYYDDQLNKISNITIVDGSSGDKKTLTDEVRIKAFLNSINNIKIPTASRKEEVEGYKYLVILYDGKNEFRFTTTHIGDVYFQVDELTQKIENIYNDAN